MTFFPRLLAVLSLAIVCCLFLGVKPPAQNTKAAQPNEAPNSKTVTSAAIPADAKIQTFTGKVSDTNCGPRHFMLANATDAECTRACFARRGLYALVVGDKVYALVNIPGSALNQLAGQQVSITGNLVNESTIAIDSISPLSGKAEH